MQDPRDIHEGRKLLAGRYQVLRELGEGAAALVFKAQDLELDRTVAIKLLTGASEIASTERFLLEAEVLARLHHPNIVRIFDCAVEGGRAYLVLEYVDGGSLLTVLERSPPPLGEALSWAAALLDALTHAHAEGVLHRDVKPANVLLTRDRIPKLADFGLAKYRGSRVRTATGLILGTPSYMAPELFTGSKPTEATDAYSWGCLLHCLIHGQPPSTGSIAEIVQSFEVGVLSESARRGPAGKVLAAALERHPDRRSSTATLRKELAEEARRNERAGSSEFPRRTLEISSRVPKHSRSSDLQIGATTAVRAPITASSERASGTTNRASLPRVLASSLLAVGLGVVAWSTVFQATPPAPMAEPADSPRTRSEQAEELRNTWRTRGRELDARGTIARLHALTYRPEDERQIESYQQEMAKARAREQVPSDPTALAGAATKLPHRDALRAELGALNSLLGDPEVPFNLRRQLAEALQPFVDVDAYFLAWGRAAPFEAEQVVRSLFPVSVERLPTELREEKLSDGDAGHGRQLDERSHPLDREPAPGTHLIYHFADSQRESPILIQHADRLSSFQDVMKMTFQGITFRGHDFETYREVSLELPMGPDPGKRFRRLALRLRVGNLNPPDALRIEFNRTRVHWQSVRHRPTRKRYYFYQAPEYVVEVELPIQSLEEGSNKLRFRVVELPGLLHYYPCDLYSVHLILEE